MPSISERALIAAEPEIVWHTVHEDLRNAKRWSPRLKRARTVRGRPGPGWVVAYQVVLPGWEGEIEVTHDTWDPPRECSGHFSDGPLKGTWSYEYRRRAGKTAMSYRMDYELNGLLRFLGGVLNAQYAAGIREQMVELKGYLEDGA